MPLTGTAANRMWLPRWTLVPQIPELDATLLTSTSQNGVEVNGWLSPRIPVTEKSPNLESKLPVQRWCVAASRAPAALFAEHEPPDLVTFPPGSLTLVVCSRVLCAPSMRTVTDVAAAAAGVSASVSAAISSARLVLVLM